MTKYTLSGDDAPVTVELTVPAGWAADATNSSSAGPAWTLPGARTLSLLAISPRGDDDATRVGKAIRMQFSDLADGDRAELAAGRVWVAHQDGDNIHARIFVPFAAGVVMGVAVLSEDAAGKLPEIKAAFETIAIV